MSKPFPALCRDCKHSEPEPGSAWNNMCFHAKVVAQSAYALANNNFEGGPRGVACRDERGRWWPFAACGVKGKLWEPR